MMFKYLDQANKDKVINHIKESFPEEKESKSYDSSFDAEVAAQRSIMDMYDYNPIIAAIATNENVEAMLEKFRADFAPGVIKKGKHFNIKILLGAFLACNFALYDYQWTSERYSLLEQHIIGHIFWLLPACYVQAFRQGLYPITECGKPLQRSYFDGQFYPLNDSGLEYAAEGCYVSNLEFLFKNYIKQKTSALRDLLSFSDNRVEKARTMQYSD